MAGEPGAFGPLSSWPWHAVCQDRPAGAGSCCGSCTRPLRIIPLVLKPGKMPSYHNDLRGYCHGVTPVLLPTRSVGAYMDQRAHMNEYALQHISVHMWSL